MRSAEIDARVQRIAEEARAGRPNEDGLIELKGKWPKPEDAAWKLGGHANAARGEPILWVIGLLPDGTATSPKREELADWWPQVCKRFDDGIVPTIIRDTIVHLEGGSVVALLFDTEAAPFVVKVKDGNHGVPYREGTRCDNVRRRHLTRMLVPLSKLPTVETIDCVLAARPSGTSRGPGPEPIHFDWALFATPPHIQEPVFVAMHRSFASIHDLNGRPIAPPAPPPFTGASGIQNGTLFLNIPRELHMLSTVGFDREAMEASVLVCRLSLAIAGSDRPVVLEERLQRDRSRELARWVRS